MLISTFSVCEEVVISMHACMYVCLNLCKVVADCCLCVCVVYVYVVRSTCLQGGAVYIDNSGKGTFTNCNFTSNEANDVSLEEEHADKSETYMIY